LGIRASGTNKQTVTVLYPDAGTLFPWSVCRFSQTETLGEQTI